MIPTDFVIYNDEQEVAAHAVELIVSMLKSAIEQRGRASLVLAGGSSYALAYHLLGEADLDWSRVAIFSGDERCVPMHDENSNAAKAEKLFISQLRTKPQTYWVDTSLPSIEAAKTYENVIRTYDTSELPRFDVVLLGLGPDGHTASIFPQELPRLLNSQALVEASTPGLPPYLERVTLTPRIINAARTILVLVIGEQKRAIMETLTTRHVTQYPIEVIQPTEGTMRWLFDSSAAPLAVQTAPKVVQ